MAALMFILWGLICLAWQAGNSYPGLNPAFMDLFEQLFIFCVLLGLVFGKSGLEIIKLIPKKFALNRSSRQQRRLFYF